MVGPEPLGFHKKEKDWPETLRMAVTMLRQYAAKLAASVELATLQLYQLPLNSHPKRKMALLNPADTRFWARVTKFEL